MIQDLYIVGATGKVGSTLIKQIFEKGDTDSARHPNPTRIVGLASSTHTLYSPEGISQEQAYTFTNRDYCDAQSYNRHDELLNRAKNGIRTEDSRLIFVDVTALNEPMTQFHLQVMRETPYSIVTANKNPLALSDYATFQKLTHQIRRYGYSCSVMAGAEVIHFLQVARDLNDNLQTIEGCLSGTNGYITSELENGGKLSEILRRAHKEGYTEPHPRDDLSGLDVARKLVILARTAGYHVGIENVQVEPFIPEKYLLEEDVGRFLDSITELDAEFKERMNRAREKGQTLRYVAQMDVMGETPALKVSLQEVPKESHLGSLKGTLNKVLVTTEAYPNGHPIEAEGAGLIVTARNIRGNLLELILERRNSI